MSIPCSTDVDLFAGPGGWDQGGLALGLRPVGFEWDESVCRTAVAAGHLRIRADVSRYPTTHLRGKVRGLIASAPCPTFSAAGKGAGKPMLTALAAAMVETLNGRNVVARTRRICTGLVRPSAPTKRRVNKRWVSCDRAWRSEWARRQAFMSCLVLEVARWVRDCDPEWIALEQVPAVLPLWEVLAHELRKRGYSVWCGNLNAADYGVPQTRIRAILIASKTRKVGMPPATHAEKPGTGGLFEPPRKWISMASALGWGMTDSPVPTVTAGGTETGGAEPIAQGGRKALARARARTLH